MNRIPLWVILIYLWAGCDPVKSDQESDDFESAYVGKDSIYEVSVIEIEPEDFYYPVKAQGTLSPWKSISLSFNRAGKIENLFVQNGSFVKKGQLIATLQHESLSLELEEAKINLKKSKLDFNKLLVDFSDSLRRKFWPQIREDLSLQAGVPQNEINLQKAQLRLSEIKIRALFSGIIDGLNKNPGSSTGASETLANLQSTDYFAVKVEILEFDISRLSIGDEAVVSPLYASDQSIKGKINEIDPRVKENGYVSVRLKIPYQQELLAGMSVTVVFNVPVERSLVVPKKAIVQKSGKPVIFTVEDDKAKWNYVTLGKENGTHWQVIEGLKPNNKVVVSNNLQLAHDTPVQIANSN